MAGPPAAPFMPHMQMPQQLPSLPSTAPSSAPQFMPPPPTPLSGQTAYGYNHNYNAYNPWALMQAGYYNNAGYYPPVMPVSYAPNYAPNYAPSYAPNYAPVYAPSNVPSYWYGQ